MLFATCLFVVVLILACSFLWLAINRGHTIEELEDQLEYLDRAKQGWIDDYNTACLGGQALEEELEQVRPLLEQLESQLADANGTIGALSESRDELIGKHRKQRAETLEESVRLDRERLDRIESLEAQKQAAAQTADQLRQRLAEASDQIRDLTEQRDDQHKTLRAVGDSAKRQLECLQALDFKRVAKKYRNNPEAKSDGHHEPAGGEGPGAGPA